MNFKSHEYFLEGLKKEIATLRWKKEEKNADQETKRGWNAIASSMEKQRINAISIYEKYFLCGDEQVLKHTSDWIINMSQVNSSI